MEQIRRVRKTDLARNSSQIIRSVQRGQTVLVENHGQAEAAILDIVDYRMLRAVIGYYARPPKIDPNAGLSEEALEKLESTQEVYDLVIAHHLAGAISTGRAAELLDLPWLDLRSRFIRLDVPVKLGAENESEALAEARAARKF